MYLKTMQAYEGFAMYLMYLRRIGDAPRVWCQRAVTFVEEESPLSHWAESRRSSVKGVDHVV